MHSSSSEGPRKGKSGIQDAAWVGVGRALTPVPLGSRKKINSENKKEIESWGKDNDHRKQDYQLSEITPLGARKHTSVVSTQNSVKLLPPEKEGRQQGQEKATDPVCGHKSGLDKSVFIQRLKKRSQNLQMYGRKKKKSHKAISKRPKSWGAQIFHAGAWIQNVFFLLE